MHGLDSTASTPNRTRAKAAASDLKEAEVPLYYAEILYLAKRLSEGSRKWKDRKLKN